MAILAAATEDTRSYVYLTAPNSERIYLAGNGSATAPWPLYPNEIENRHDCLKPNRMEMIMAKDESKPFAPPVYQGDEAIRNADVVKTPFTTQSDHDHDRGKRAQAGTGPVVGSGAGVGGTSGGNEDYDDDDIGGGRPPPTGSPANAAHPRDRQAAEAAGEEADLPAGSISL